MGNKQWWIDKALDEAHSIIEMAQEIMRGSERGKLNVRGAHFVSSAIQGHARTARRYLSYAARCKEEQPNEQEA